MKKIAVIPARLQATRFPKKLLEDLGGRSVIEQTYLATVGTDLFDQVWVATDSPEIAEKIKHIGGEVFLSQIQHNCGSNRIAEAVENLPADIIVNVQGDEPFIQKKSLQPLLEVFDDDPKQQIDLASLMMPLTDPEEIANPNNVKVVVDSQSFALYFSRSPIPFARDTEKEYTYKKHIGVYAFRKDALMEFYHLSPTPLEETEKLEQLRYLENGRRIKMVLSEVENIGIDTPEDLEKARKYWKNIY
jgi:3-deoxy-D-manno-octulosonate cytidylyltransferase